MPTPLGPLSVVAPGFFGLNKQESASSLAPGWATTANNCAFDDAGRIAARKGWLKVTSSAIAGTPAIESLHEYLNSTGTSEIVSAAANKLYVGDTTLTDKTGTLTITDDNWKFQNFNGGVIGVQASHEPIWYDGTGNFTLLHDELTSWAATTAYVVGDVVKSTAGNTTIYFHCTTAGTTGGTEPTWSTSVGSTTGDGTVTWTTRQFPQATEALAALGRMWMVDANNTVIHYSDLLIPYAYSGGSSGSIDLKSVWVYGMDEIVALAEHNGYLIIFGKKSTVVYGGADDPSTMAIVEQLSGIGCIARDTVQHVDADLWWLSDQGVRSFSRVIQEKSLPIGDVSKNVRDYLNTALSTETKVLLRAVYHPADNMYLLNLPTNGITFCFDTHTKLPDGSARVTTWDTINPTSMCSLRSGALYLGQAGVIGKYQDYTDNSASYLMTYKSGWNSFGEQAAAFIKIPKKLSYLFFGGAGYAVTATLGFDFEEDAVTSQKSIASEGIAQFNVAEFNVDAFSGSGGYSVLKFFPRKDGQVIQFGFTATIDTNALSLQRIDLLVKRGRYA